MNTKTVVELDLVGYSDVSRELEQHLGPEVVARFNEQIQEFVDTSLKSAAIARAEVVIATTGDGTILAFNRANDAHVFAVGLHRCVQEHNKRCQIVSAQRWFRTGIATGELYQSANGAYAGTVIATAVRLETAARPGEIVADAATFSQLPRELQALYGREEQIAGKRAERFAARRCAVIPYAGPKPAGKKAPGSRIFGIRSSLVAMALAFITGMGFRLWSAEARLDLGSYIVVFLFWLLLVASAQWFWRFARRTARP